MTFRQEPSFRPSRLENQFMLERLRVREIIGKAYLLGRYPVSDPIVAPMPTLLEQLQAETRRKTAALPPDKNHAIVMSAEWKAGVPVRWRWGTAHRVGDHFELSTEAATKFTKASTEASVHLAWSW